MDWIENLHFECLEGDLLDASSMALMCPVHVELRPYGAISRKLFAQSSQRLDERLQLVRNSLEDQRLRLGESTSISTKGLRLAAPIDTLVLTALWADESEYSKNLFYKSYLSAIREAMRTKCNSIALPAMAYAGHARVAAEALKDVLLDLDALVSSGKFKLLAIYVITSNPKHLKNFKTHCEDLMYR